MTKLLERYRKPMNKGNYKIPLKSKTTQIIKHAVISGKTSTATILSWSTALRKNIANKFLINNCITFKPRKHLVKSTHW